MLAFKVIRAVAGRLRRVLLLSTMLKPAPLVSIVAISLLAFVGFVLPDSIVNRKVQERQKEILKTLSDTLDLLTISVEAGLVAQRRDRPGRAERPGVLSSGVRRMLQEIQLGVPRSEAFRHLADRTDVEELNGFALAMIQADVFGVSIASVFAPKHNFGIKRRQAAEAKAQQTPVKIVFPLVLCILPALFVVIVGPGRSRSSRSSSRTSRSCTSATPRAGRSRTSQVRLRPAFEHPTQAIIRLYHRWNTPWTDTQHA